MEDLAPSLGLGFDALNSQKRNTAISKGEKVPLTPSCRKYRFNFVETQASLDRVVSLAQSGNAKIFDTLSVEGGGSALSSLSTFSTSLTMVAEINIFESEITYRNDVFTELAATTLPDTRKFFEIYGTHFVDEVLLGGRLLAIYAVSARNSTEWTAVAGEMKLAIKQFGGAEGQFFAVLKKFDAYLHIGLQIEVQGKYSVPVSEVKDVESFQKIATEFEKSVRDNPVELGYRLAEYTQVEGRPEGVHILGFDKSLYRLNALKAFLAEFRTKKNEAAYIRSSQDMYDPSDVKDLAQTTSKIETAIKILTTDISRLKENPLSVDIPEDPTEAPQGADPLGLGAWPSPVNTLPIESVVYVKTSQKSQLGRNGAAVPTIDLPIFMPWFVVQAIRIYIEPFVPGLAVHYRIGTAHPGGALNWSLWQRGDGETNVAGYLRGLAVRLVGPLAKTYSITCSGRWYPDIAQGGAIYEHIEGSQAPEGVEMWRNSPVGVLSAIGVRISPK